MEMAAFALWLLSLSPFWFLVFCLVLLNGSDFVGTVPDSVGAILLLYPFQSLHIGQSLSDYVSVFLVTYF